MDHLSIEVHAGQMVGFLGPNGAGKSTSLYMASRLVRPSAGRVQIFGHDVWKDFKEAMCHVGIMVENPRFYEYLSARKNLELMARLRGSDAKSEIDEILERIGLFDRRKDKVAGFSQGMKQRLGLGMAMVGKPRLLILDEPTNGMDPEGTREILTFLKERIKDDGLTVFISSHLLYEVEEYCDEVFVIDNGREIASGKVKDILAPHDKVIQVCFKGAVADGSKLESEEAIVKVESLSEACLEITLANQDSVWLGDFLRDQGYKVSALVPRQKTLKEFFLSVTGENKNG